MEDKIVTIQAIKKNGLGTVSRIPSSTYTVPALLTRGGYVTGLSKEDETTLEKELGLEPNTLTRTSKFWKEYNFKIHGEKDVKLDLSLAQDYLDYKLCMAFPKIANNEEELNAAAHDFVIIDEDKKANKELVRIKQHDNAILAYTKMSDKEMKDALKLMGYKVSSMSIQLAQTTLRKAIDENPAKFNDIVNDPEYKTKVFIKELELNGVISKSGTKYFFGDINNVIGNTVEEVIEYIKDKDNNDVVIQLKRALAKEQSK